ncbi:metal-dependent hydrolase [Shewanella algicola]|uniref:Metal-dependent hydrolase n=1 Tax=Shewanella algicola TaxID=640633 RepID=A0A9X2CCK3_9GAMM|nr:metal-dependent hydrolase [Shewanella algicola]MCL1104516.1 metal-dependent hydrolase [Shewanella algicola]
MMFRNHLIVTAAVAIFTVKYVNFAMPLWVVLILIFGGSLLPDLDHPSSTIGKRFLFISLPLAGLFGHRQITHSVWPFVLTAWALSYDTWATPLAMAFGIGYFSHLLADFISDSGIPLFWPHQGRFGIKLCTSGGLLEPIIALGLLWLAIIF